MTDVDLQRMNGLRVANEQRKVIKNLKQDLEAGTRRVGDILFPQPMRAVEAQLLVDVGRWARNYGSRAYANQAALGEQAIADNVNLLVSVGAAPQAHRAWLADHVDRGPSSSAERTRVYRERRDPDTFAKKRLAKVILERDEALVRVKELERALAGRQLVMPAVTSERMLAELADAVEEHRRGLSNGAPDFADADRRLWDAKDEILASDPLTRLVVA